MIIAYSVKNFLSIGQEIIIDFRAKKYKETKLKVLNYKEHKLVPLIALYGPNASGKSSVISSINILMSIVRLGNLGNNDPIINNFFNGLKYWKNFAFTDKPIEWKIKILSSQGIEYTYYLTIDTTKIVFEKLEMLKNNQTVTIFEKNLNENKLSLNPDFFSNLNLKQEIPGSIFNFLYHNIQNSQIQDFGNTFLSITILDNTKITPAFVGLDGKIKYNFDLQILKDNRSKFLELFKTIDINIIDYYIDANGTLILEKDQLLVQPQKINFLNESEGTKRFIQLMCWIFAILKNGWVLFIDELNINLHPKLLAYILELLRSEQNEKGQLIFTSHDLYTLDSNYLRKDEIYFAYLNEAFQTDLVCLSQIKGQTRENSSYSNKYLKGDYGADPYIQKCFDWINIPEDNDEKI